MNEFVTPEVGEDLGSMNEDQARSLLEGFLIRSFQQILYENVEQAQFWFVRAVNVYNMFEEKTKNRNGRQGWTSSFSIMAERALEYVKSQAPAKSIALQNFYDSVIKPKESDKKAK